VQTKLKEINHSIINQMPKKWMGVCVFRNV